MSSTPTISCGPSFDIWLANWLESFIVQSENCSIRDADLVQQFSFIPGLKELLMLRQVHALEHATVWILSNAAPTTTPLAGIPTDNERFGGMSTDQGFYLYGSVNWLDLQRAVKQALDRLLRGEWQLAIHPRCGTNLSVNMLLTSGLALGAHLLLPREPLEQLIGIGLAATTAAQLTPEVGTMVQRYFTTALPVNLEIVEITDTTDPDGHPAHFVRVRWIDSQR